MSSQEYPCPACGFLVFDEPTGSYEICPVCGWEDDHLQLRFPFLRGGANKASLIEHQRLWTKGIPLTVRERKGFHREGAWRPLRADECAAPDDAPRSGDQYFQAACEDPPPYYWRETPVATLPDHEADAEN